MIICFGTAYRAMYRAAGFIVEMAITKPRIPKAKGITMCQHRSPDLLECLAMKSIR